MRYWMITEPVEGSSVPVYHIYSDDAIIEEYWTYFSNMGARRGVKATPEECIDHWVVVHWAQEVTRQVLEQFVDGK